MTQISQAILKVHIATDAKESMEPIVNGDHYKLMHKMNRVFVVCKHNNASFLVQRLKNLRTKQKTLLFSMQIALHGLSTRTD